MTDLYQVFVWVPPADCDEPGFWQRYGRPAPRLVAIEAACAYRELYGVSTSVEPAG